MLPGRKVIQSSLQTILVINDVNLSKRRGGGASQLRAKGTSRPIRR